MVRLVHFECKESDFLMERQAYGESHIADPVLAEYVDPHRNHPNQCRCLRPRRKDRVDISYDSSYLDSEFFFFMLFPRPYKESAVGRDNKWMIRCLLPF